MRGWLASPCCWNLAIDTEEDPKNVWNYRKRDMPFLMSIKLEANSYPICSFAPLRMAERLMRTNSEMIDTINIDAGIDRWSRIMRGNNHVRRVNYENEGTTGRYTSMLIKLNEFSFQLSSIFASRQFNSGAQQVFKLPPWLAVSASIRKILYHFVNCTHFSVAFSTSARLRPYSVFRKSLRSQIRRFTARSRLMHALYFSSLLLAILFSLLFIRKRKWWTNWYRCTLCLMYRLQELAVLFYLSILALPLLVWLFVYLCTVHGCGVQSN